MATATGKKQIRVTISIDEEQFQQLLQVTAAGNEQLAIGSSSFRWTWRKYAEVAVRQGFDEFLKESHRIYCPPVAEGGDE